MPNLYLKYRRKLENIILKAKQEGITIFAHFDGYLLLVDTETYDKTDDLRTLTNYDYESVSLDICGTPIQSQRDPFGNG